MYFRFHTCLVLVLLVLLQYNDCIGQLSIDRRLVFNNIGTEDGLPHSFVNVTIQDDHGFIWIGTNDGLCRFDSHEKYKIFKGKDVNIKGGLESSNISELHLATGNILYVGTRQGGLTIYDIENDSWETYMYNENDPTTISDDEILSIHEDIKGRLWVGTENGLNLFNKETKTFKRYIAEPAQEGKLKAKAILSISEDNNGWIWVGTWDGGMYLLDIHPMSDDIYFRHFNPSGEVKRNCIWNIYQDDYENYWVGSHTEGLYLMSIPDEANPNDRSWEPTFLQYNYVIGDVKSIPANYIDDITKDGNGNLWIATVFGVSIVPSELISEKFDGKHKPKLIFNNNKSDQTIKTSIPDNNVVNVYRDNNNIMWLSTRAGCSRYNPLSNQIQDYKLFDLNYGMPNSQNYYVDNENKCWIAAGEKGLYLFDKETNSYKNILHHVLKHHQYTSAIYSKDYENIFIATARAIIRYNTKTKSVKEYFFELDALIDVRKSYVIQMIQDDDWIMWLSSENGLIKLDLKAEQFQYFQNDPLDSKSLVDNSVSQTLIDHNGDIWFSTLNGLSKLVKDNEKISFKNYKANKKVGGLRSNKITALVDLDSIMIIGTRDGILGYNYEKEIFQEYLEDNEKINVNSMIAVPNGEVWGVGLSSIFKFDPSTKKLLSFDYHEGASNAQYLRNSILLSQDTVLHFGHMSGFTEVNPFNFKTNSTPPNLAVTEVEVFNPDGHRQINMMHQHELEVNSDHYSIEINFAALNYNRPEKTKYAYILEGFDQDWKYLDKNLSATYTNLDHGNYTFKVKAANEVGIWSKDTSLPITIKPSFFETNIAKILLLFLTGILIYLVIKFYTIRIQTRNKELQNFNNSLNKEIQQREAIELELQKTNLELTRSNKELEQFAYIASHDLQEPLRITGSFIDLLGERYADVLDENAFKFIDFAKGGIGRMGLLIKNLLTFSKVGGTVLDFHKASTEEIVNEKLLDLAGLITDKNATIELGNLPQIVCEKNQIAMLFYNLINNAMKFNDKANPIVKISLQPSEYPDMHLFSVSDNGIGIDPAHKDKIFEIFKRLHDKDQYDGTGIGLALCKKIVDRHGGNIWVDSVIGEGTTFNFTLAKDPTTQQDSHSFELNRESVSAS